MKKKTLKFYPKQKHHILLSYTEINPGLDCSANSYKPIKMKAHNTYYMLELHQKWCHSTRSLLKALRKKTQNFQFVPGSMHGPSPSSNLQTSSTNVSHWFTKWTEIQSNFWQNRAGDFTVRRLPSICRVRTLSLQSHMQAFPSLSLFSPL